MPDPAARRILADISPKHREMVLQGADEQAMSARSWLERAIEQWRPVDGPEVISATETVRTEVDEEVGEVASETAKAKPTGHRHPIGLEAAASAGSASGGGPDAGPRGRAEASSQEALGAHTVQTVRQDRIEAIAAPGPHPHAHPHAAPAHAREEGRPGGAAMSGEGEPDGGLGARRHVRFTPEGLRSVDGVSDYHSRLASREAAAEDLPLTIWLEQAISHRAEVRTRATARPAPPPPADPASVVVVPGPASTVAPQAQGAGLGPLAALLLGALAAALLFLILPWLVSGRPLFPAAGSGASSTASTSSIPSAFASATVTAPAASPSTTPPVPAPPVPAPPPAAPPAAPTPNVSVTMMVNTAQRGASARSRASIVRRIHRRFPIRRWRPRRVFYDSCGC